MSSHPHSVGSDRLLEKIAGRFTLIEFLGEGTVGRTYLADDAVRHQKVIIKLVHADVLEDGGGFEDLRQTLNQLASLSHPRIGRLYDFGLSGEQLYLVLEPLAGLPLSEWLRQKSNEPSSEFPTPELMMAQLATTLIEIGEATPHGSLKPAHLWIDANGRLKLADHGLHQLVSTSKRCSSATFLQTSSYLPPETFDGHQPISQAADAFALGMIWKEWIGARAPMLKPTKEASHWIGQLTASDPSERLAALERVAAQAKAPEGDRGAMATRYRLMGGTLVLAGLIFLLVWALPRISHRDTEIAKHAAVPSSTEIFEQANRLHQRRNALITALSQVPDLAGPLLREIDATALIDSLWIIDRSRTAGQAPEAAYQEASQRLHTESLRLDYATDLLRHWKRTQDSLQVQKSLAEDLSEGVAPNDGPEKQTQILDSLRSGDLRLAVQSAESLATALEEHWRELWKQTSNEAHRQQSRWRAVLAKHVSLYLEPAEDLSAVLKRHGHHVDADLMDLPDALPRLRAAAASYARWTKALEEVPPPSPECEVNSLGMRFRACGDLQASVWETRVLDFAAFVHESGTDMRTLWREAARDLSPTHPVVSISGHDAADFCRWLTERERHLGLIGAHQQYRLPSDLEWSRLAGLHEPDDGRSPFDRGWEFQDHYPWGAHLPVKERGNYHTSINPGVEKPDHEQDVFLTTAPVGQFPANAFGLHDLGGNVWEWVSDNLNAPDPVFSRRLAIARGGSWRTLDSDVMRTAYRLPHVLDLPEIGFRVVLANAPAERENLDTMSETPGDDG